MLEATERLDRDYRRARSATRAGGVALYVLAAFDLIAAVKCHLLALPQDLLGGSPLRPLAVLICAGISVSPIVPLAEFLRRFGRLDHPPFGDGQAARLVVAAILMVPGALLDMVVPLGQAASAELSFSPTRAYLSLKISSVIIFLVCLAMIVRYGDALKEDSDSFG